MRINQAKLLAISVFLFSIQLVKSQGVGSNPNQLIPQISEPETFTGDNFNGNVSILSGTYNGSYTLGQVSTPGGLSFVVKINYSSDKIVGGTESISKGIPYGDGWSIELPSISPVSFVKNKYKAIDIQNLVNKNNGTTKHTENVTYNNKEGDVYIQGYHISIPGKLNCKAIYKYTDATGQDIFVPAIFEKYAQIRRQGDNWEITLEDGTKYFFNLAVETYRAGPQKRGIIDYNGVATGTAADQVLPRKEYLKWYCTRIKNPNIPGQEIALIYDRFGKFNFFKEYTVQQGISAVFRTSGFHGAAYSYGPLETYRDILLKQVVTYTPYGNSDRIDLNYESIQSGQSGLDISDNEVYRFDSLYSYKSVSSSSSFGSWKRYLHGAHDRVQPLNPMSTPSVATGLEMEPAINSRNPYLINHPAQVPLDYYVETISNNPSSIAFDHGYLESYRIGASETQVPGDLYEIKSTISKNASDQGGFCNFDIAVVTGNNSTSSTFGNFVSQDGYNYFGNGRASETIYSTFQKAVKWNTKGENIPYHPSTTIHTSSLFQMPNLPISYGGFYIQIGPANSDHLYNLSYKNTLTLNSSAPGQAFKAYSHELHQNPGGLGQQIKNATHAYYEPISSNFGLGMPWYMMKDIYKSMGAGVSDVTSLNYQFWFKNNQIQSGGSSVGGWQNVPNIPTLAGPSTSLSNFELIRYSKNPYMLKSVETYKVTSEDHAAAVGNTVLTKRIELDYTLKDTVLVDNRQYVDAESFGYKSLTQSTYLLSSIQEVPVDPTSTSIATITGSELISQRFEYTSSYTPRKFNSSFPIVTSNIYLLQKVISPYGNIIDIEYYPLKKDSCMWGVKSFPSDATYIDTTTLNKVYRDQVLAQFDKMRFRDGSFQVNALVKNISIKKSNTLDQVKNYTYSFGSYVLVPNIHFEAAPILSAGGAFQYGIQVGFKNTTVTTKSADDDANYVVYEHYGNTSTNSLNLYGGKIASEKYYDANDNILREVNNDYTTSKAYMNGYQRPARDIGKWDFDYMDYYYQRFFPTNFSTFKNWNNENDITFSPLNMHFSLTDYSSNTPLTSYFLRLTKKSEKVYDPDACVAQKPSGHRPGGLVVQANDNDALEYVNESSEEGDEDLLDLIEGAEDYEAILEDLQDANPLSDEVITACLNKEAFHGTTDFMEILEPHENLSDAIYTILLSTSPLLESQSLYLYDSEKDNQFTEPILTLLIEKEDHFGETYVQSKLLLENQLSDSLQLQILAKSDDFSQGFLSSVFENQEGLSAEVRLALFDEGVGLSFPRIKDVLLAHEPYPADTIIDIIITDFATSHPDEVSEIINASPTSFSQDVYNTVIAHQASFQPSQIESFNYLQENSPSLIANCTSPSSNQNLYIETITEYDYFTATPSGVSYSDGYRELFDKEPTDSIYLKYEPSWQLYRQKTYSPQYPQAYQEQRFFYYFDLRNRFDRYLNEYNAITSNFPSSTHLYADTTWADITTKVKFDITLKYGTDTLKPPTPDGMIKSVKHQIRNLPFQTTSVQKNSEDGKPSTHSNYYDFHSKWGPVYDPHDAKKFVPVQGDSTQCPNDTCKWQYQVNSTQLVWGRRKSTGKNDSIVQVIGLAIYHNLIGRVYNAGNSGTYFVVYKDSPCTFGSDTNLVYANYPPGKLPVVPTAENQLIKWTLKDVALLGNSYTQIDTVKTEAYKTFMNNSHTSIFGDNGLVQFDSIAPYVIQYLPNGNPRIYYEDHYPMVFPYDTLTTMSIRNRNRYTLPTLFIEQNGLKTRLEYDSILLIEYIDTTCNRSLGTIVDYGSMGKPIKAVVYPTANDSLVTSFEYYNDLSLKSITDPYGLVSTIRYDAYGRQRETRENGELINRYVYSHWDGDDADDFMTRTEQNYLQVIHFQNDSNEAALINRKYFDPLGRDYQNVNGVLEFGVNSDSISESYHSGKVIYDSRDRILKQYKPFAFKDPSKQIIPELKQQSHDLVAYPDAFAELSYESDWNGRALKAASPGENIITGHYKSNSYQLLNSHCFSCDLGLSNLEINLIMPQSTDSNYVFSKSSVLDEDNKIVETYINAIGQTVATRQQLSGGEDVVTVFAYDNRGNQSTVINPKNQKSTYDYNILNWMYKKETVDGGVTKLMYNKSGQVTMMQDEKAIQGRLNSSTNLTEEYVTLNHYDRLGNLIWVKDAFLNNLNGQSTKLSPLYYDYFLTGDSSTVNFPLFDPTYFEYIFTNNSTYDWNSSGGRYFYFTGGPGGYVKRIQVISDSYVGSGSLRLENIYNNKTAWLNSMNYVATEIKNNNTTAYRKGRLHFTLKYYDHDMDYHYNTTGDHINELTLYNYDQKGNVVSMLKQFNSHKLASTFRTDFISKQNFEGYNHDGAYNTHNVDIDADGHIDIQYHRELDPRNQTKALYVNHADDKSTGNLLATFNYDNTFGRLLKKKTYYKHGSLLEMDSIFYSYDLRDRLTSINSEWMDYALYYDGNQASYNGHTPAGHLNYNGNINGIKVDYKLAQADNYTTGNLFDEPTVYNYQYDAMNRLRNADAAIGDFLEGTNSNDISYKMGDASFVYDIVGNISTLDRYTDASGTNQNFQMNYSGYTNKLVGVNNSVLTYDVAGNLKSDQRRDITLIEYLSNNLPRTINVLRSNTFQFYNYTYDASGQRVYKYDSEPIEATPWLGPERAWYYLQDLQGKTIAIYDVLNINWEFYAHEGDRIARIKPDGLLQPHGHTGANAAGSELSNINFYSYDHLGNTRVTYEVLWDTENNQLKKNLKGAYDYFPYGKILRSFQGAGSGHERYLTTQHERDYETISNNSSGTGLDNRGARFYDSDVARFLSLDPAAMEYPSLSDYNYVAGNPIMFIDPDGRNLEPIYDTKGNHLGNTEEGFTGEVLIYSGDKKDIDFSSMSAAEAKKLDGIDSYDNQRDNITGDANSKIWTHIASQMEGISIYGQEFNMSSITNSKIGYTMYGKPGAWNTNLREGTIVGTDRYSYQTTVENLQSSIVVHEWYSHLKMGVSDENGNHSQAYKNVIGYKSLWNKTTQDYKDFNYEKLQKYIDIESQD